MRIILLSLLAGIAICSCNERSGHAPTPAADTTVVPQALQEEKSSKSYSSKSYRGSGDLVDELYAELKKQTPALQELEDNIDRVKTQKMDSSEAFNEYNQKNNDYYSSANRHLESIKDSATRERIRTLITRSISGYESRASANKDLLALLNKKDVALDDLYTAMKITKTMVMIEKFQRQNLPSTKPLEKVNKEFDKVISNL